MVVNGIYFLRVADAAKQNAISIAEYYARASRGLVPPPLKIGIRASRIPSNENEAVIRARIAGKTDDEIKTIVSKLVTARADLFDGDAA